MASKNLFGWASQSEKGTVNGKKGDQTGSEVKVGNYYQFGQTDVARFKSVEYGRKAGEATKYLCKCELIGYGQSDRQTLFDQCAKYDWNLSKIQKAVKDGKFAKCNTDCSALAATVINIAYGKKIVGCFSTSTMKKELVRCTEKFTFLTPKQAEKQFHKGDLVYKVGHVIINV